MGEHPTELDLELLRTGEAEAGVESHVERCAACQDRLAAQRSLARRIAHPLALLEVPSELDDALARRARERALRIATPSERRRGNALRRALPKAAAACLLLGLGGFLALRVLEQRPGGPGPAPEWIAIAPQASLSGAAGTDDVNSDGRVDVVDAYLVARAAERGGAPARFDVNRDGRVDRRDAERIAVVAVALGARSDG